MDDTGQPNKGWRRTPGTAVSKAAMAILDRMRGISEGTLVFPAARGGKMDSKILPGALKAAGVDATLHGFRSSALGIGVQNQT